MLAHAGVGGTNNNCGTEGGWNGVKKEICCTAGPCRVDLELGGTFSGPVDSSLLCNKSKEQASHWRSKTEKRCKTSRAMFTFPSIPMPSKEEWVHLESLCHNILELCTVYARADVKTDGDRHIGGMLVAAEEEGVTGSAAHVQIRALFNKKPTPEPPPRRNFLYVNRSAC